jgi:hypothetical protein
VETTENGTPETVKPEQKGENTQPARTGLERRLANLKPFSKDRQPANRGIPKRRDAEARRFADLLPPENFAEIVRKIAPNIRGKITHETVVWAKTFASAEQGDTQAAKVVFDSLYGSAPQSINLKNNGGKFGSVDDIGPEELERRVRERLEDLGLANPSA